MHARARHGTETRTLTLLARSGAGCRMWLVGAHGMGGTPCSGKLADRDTGALRCPRSAEKSINQCGVAPLHGPDIIRPRGVAMNGDGQHLTRSVCIVGNVWNCTTSLVVRFRYGPLSHTIPWLLDKARLFCYTCRRGGPNHHTIHDHLVDQCQTELDILYSCI